ncbi:serine/threonine protein kinase [Archangium primigenium]|nr:serine/threonine-protein kinase [Archangium primigenium]MBM7115214.1 serine/threonine protein kinase [Archangium primigenium]
MTDTLQYAPNIPLDATFISPSSEGGAVKTPPRVNVSAAAAAHRTTVLPRVEWAGAQPNVIPLERERFEEVRALGQGGMGEVVLLKDHDIERLVALKRLPESPGLDQVLRFVEEIRTVGQLDHPNIVPVHDVGVDPAGRYYFLMKHLQGETLESIILKLQQGDAAAHARFPFAMRVQVFIGILNALTYAHRKGFIHRDLKPANIMVGPYGEVTVMDWGLARRIHTPATGAERVPPTVPASPRDALAMRTQMGSVLGTPLYMSPEQARGEHDRLDERSDLYSASVLLHEFLFLRHYLAGRESLPQVLEGVQHEQLKLFPHPPAHPHQPPVPSEYVWLTRKGMSKDPAERYQSAEELMTELRGILEGRIHVRCSRTLIKRGLHETLRKVESHSALMMGAGGVVALLLLASLAHLLYVLFS